MKIESDSSLAIEPRSVTPMETEVVNEGVKKSRTQRRAVIPDAEKEEDEDSEEETLEEAEAIPFDGIAPTVSIMGQDGASFALQGFVNDFCRTGEFPAALIITAPAGAGKSHTFDVFAGAIDKAKKGGVNIVSVGTASEFATIESDDSQALLNALRMSARGIHTVVKIDEAHLINKCGPAMRRVMDVLIYGAGQGWKRSGSVTVGTGKMATRHFNTRFLTLVLITNFPEKIMKGNREAMERRFKLIKLERYSPAIMRKLIPVYFREKEMKVEGEALTQLLKIHRGTLEALDNFREQASGHHDGIITKAVFDAVLPICKFTLRGFTRDEIKALRWLSVTKEPRTKANLVQNFPSLDVGAFYRHCKEQETKGKGADEGVATPFLLMDGVQYMVTDIAKTFLSKNPTA